MLTPLEVVQAQFDAYNARDLERFIVNFSETVKVYRMATNELAMEGKQAVASYYARERFGHPGLKAELLERMVLGNKIFDRERIWGVSDVALEVVAVFEVENGLIETMWAFAA